MSISCGLPFLALAANIALHIACALLLRWGRASARRYGNEQEAQAIETSLPEEMLLTMHRAMLLKRSTSDASFRTISIPVIKHRKSNTRKTLPPSNNF